MQTSYIQTDFSGGVNQQHDPTKLHVNEYFMLSNGRVRSKNVTPTKLPQEDVDGLPITATNYQGLYAAGNYLLLFADGKAYYRDTSVVGSVYTEVVGFLMSTTATTMYAQLIPASFNNFLRQSVDGNASSSVNLTSNIRGTPQCIIVQDGINQPWIINPDGTARVTQNYAQWSLANREYVPIGTKMLYVNGVLYVVTKDEFGRDTRLVRSVTGRPMDFVVAIDMTGNKIDPLEINGGAVITSHRVDYDNITCLAMVVTNNGGFFLSTEKSCYIIIPRLDNLRFGEPTFTNQLVASTGTLNNFSLTEIVGDSAFIDSTGIVSFNAVKQDRIEGKNYPFGARILPWFDGVIQSVTSAITFENYALFAVDSIYGPGIAVFDTILQGYENAPTPGRWVSFDLYPGMGRIKQFAEVKLQGNRRKLYCITTDGKLFQLFASSESAICRLYTQEFTTGKLDQEQTPDNVGVIFSEAKTNGTAQVQLMVDRQRASKLVNQIGAVVDTLTVPSSVPFNVYQEHSINNATFNFSGTKDRGFKLGYEIEWNSDCSLLGFKADVNVDDGESDAQSQALVIQDISTDNLSIGEDDLLVFVGNDGDVSATHLALADKVKSLNPDYIIGAGNHNYPAGSLATQQATLINYWGQQKLLGKLLFSLGAIDLDTLNGQAQIEYLNYVPQPSQRYRNFVIGQFTELFMYNGGYKSDGTLVEPDGVNVSSVQGMWLKSALESSTRPFKVVVVSESVYTSLQSKYPGKTTLQTLLFKSWGASLVVSCSEIYERLRIGDINYLTIGIGGHNLNSTINSPVKTGSVKIYNSGYGYLKATINQFQARLQMLNLDDTIIDDFIINL